MNRPLNTPRMGRRTVVAGLVVATAVTVTLLMRDNRPRTGSKPAIPPTTAPDPRLPAPRLAIQLTSPDAGLPAPSLANADDERAALVELRALVKNDPQRAEALARELRARHADSADADERDALLVDALIAQQRIGAARSETYYYFDHHPNGRHTQRLFVMTGVHPTPKRAP